MKSEPNAFSIDDLKRDGSTSWTGVRNYQARNFMRDQMKKGDKVLFYHSNTKEPGVVGTGKVSKESHPDHTALDKKSAYFDPKATQDEPRWYLVDIAFEKKFPRTVTLTKIKDTPALAEMKIVQKGNRLSITPVSKKEFSTILQLARHD